MCVIGVVIYKDMELPEQAIYDHYQLLEDRLSGVPELKPAFAIFDSAPRHVKEVYVSYMALVARMAALSTPDQERIAQSQRLLVEQGGQSGSASVVGANDIVNALGDRKNVLVEMAIRSLDPSSDYYQNAVANLVSKMEGGHKLKLSGKTPSDHDPDSLKVIWGHTLITGNEALLHFVTCHYLGLYFAETLGAEGLVFAQQKDFFVNALTDVVILEHLHSGDPDPVFDVWAAPKQDGGMGWITDSRRKSYGL